MENLYCLFPYRIYELSFKGSPTVEKLVKGEAVIPGVSLLGRRQGLQRRHRACAALGGRPRAGCGPGRFLLGGGLLPASGARRAVCGSSGWCRPRSAFIRTRLALHVRVPSPRCYGDTGRDGFAACTASAGPRPNRSPLRQSCAQSVVREYRGLQLQHRGFRGTPFNP